ncbi:MAG: hypothetical protein SCARUB_03448 [Candidatus Scalindua rubra]|uniref:Uncharacterized protein n=1 Tax=Candidatus Scalindua rubra TaxID=1872076 RepID=A0A1E3X8Z7_9BACT|nr:MAG: hypothetical protein SCARUB_03448 [Candidatus Scalindua rubra]
MTIEKTEKEWREEMEKRNFIIWYKRTTPYEIKKIKGEEKEILDRLVIKYADEIKNIK